MPPADVSLIAPRRAVLFASAGAVTLATWVWLMRMHSPLLMPHQHHATDAWSFVSAVVMWQAMMVAMMTPSVLPWLLAFATLTRRAPTAFAAGYFVIWLGYSVAGAGAQAALQHFGLLERNGQLPASAAGLVVMAAGLFQFTPLRSACLQHCRNPITYFLARWNQGPRGGFGLGLNHGAYCVGCCWALMLTGFAVGVMNMAWMALLTVLICVEKVAPHGERIGAFVAIAMLLCGAALLVVSLV